MVLPFVSLSQAPKIMKRSGSLINDQLHCQFSQERMRYLEQSGSVNYPSKDGHTTKSFTALDWLALIISHIPRHGY